MATLRGGDVPYAHLILESVVMPTPKRGYHKLIRWIVQQDESIYASYDSPVVGLTMKLYDKDWSDVKDDIQTFLKRERSGEESYVWYKPNTNRMGEKRYGYGILGYRKALEWIVTKDEEVIESIEDWEALPQLPVIQAIAHLFDKLETVVAEDTRRASGWWDGLVRGEAKSFTVVRRWEVGTIEREYQEAVRFRQKRDVQKG